VVVAGPPTERARRERRLATVRRLGAVFRYAALGCAVGLVAFLIALAYLLLRGSAPSITAFGFGFLASSSWSAPTNDFGAWPAVWGTLVTSALAVALALPVALGVALFGSEFAPPRWRRPFAYFVDLGAAIPSVVYGFWAFQVIVPFFATSIEPRLAASPIGRAVFTGPLLGRDPLVAGVVLAIMIVPTIAALSREALRSVPRTQREAALGIGATRWEASRLTVIGSALPGIVGATAVGLGRAIGETIAVALVVGGVYAPATSLLTPSTTIPSWLVGQFTESYGLQQSALFELAGILLGISLAVNVVARLLLARTGKFRRRFRRLSSRARSVSPLAAASPPSVGAPVWWSRVVRGRESRRVRRRIVGVVVVVLTVGAVAIAVFPLVSLIASSVVGGGSAVVRPSFYTATPPPACGLNQSNCPLGGIGPEIEGTLVLLGLSGAVGIPVGLLAGIYLSEYARRRAGTAIGLAVDALLGLPSILLGIFVVACFLRFDRLDAQSALAASAALALLIAPIVARATEASLRLVPDSVREGALALGFPRHRVTLRVVLGSARTALVTGILLAVMRAAGETAAVLLTAGTSTFWMTDLRSPTPALAPFIYDAVTVNLASANYTTDAWGAVLVLLLIIAAVSLAARLAVGDREGGSAV
jgi:phosphate transport system permease protein